MPTPSPADIPNIHLSLYSTHECWYDLPKLDLVNFFNPAVNRLNLALWAYDFQGAMVCLVGIIFWGVSRWGSYSVLKRCFPFSSRSWPNAIYFAYLSVQSGYISIFVSYSLVFTCIMDFEIPISFLTYARFLLWQQSIMVSLITLRGSS